MPMVAMSVGLCAPREVEFGRGFGADLTIVSLKINILNIIRKYPSIEYVNELNK